MTRTFRSLSVVILVAAVVSAAAAGIAHAASISAHRIKGGLNQPVAFTFAPSGKIFYVEKTTGVIRILNPRTGRTPSFFDVPHVVGNDERGLLGIALHPNFPQKPLVYVYATRMVSGRLRNQILRLTDRHGNGRRLRVIWSAPASANPYHNGGRILFGPDGMLYAVVGEGHRASNSQDLSHNDRGKILRMMPNGDVPADNPFPNRRIESYGHRNSFGFAFDPQTGDLWETENGPECNDEINRIVAGENYGWGPNATCGGSAPRDTNQDGPSPVLPTLYFASTIGITGDAFCDGCHLNARSEGDLFWGAVNNGKIYRVGLNNNRTDTANSTLTTVFTNPSGSTLSYEVAPNGSICFSDFTSIYRLTVR